MSQPMSIDDVPYYKIAGQYCFSGDLIFTAGSIYFFPRTDLNRQRAKNRESLSTPVLELFDEFILRPVVSPLLHALAIRSTNRSQLRETGLWREDDSGEALKSKLDGLIRELKRNYTPAAPLPLPSHFARGEVSNLKLSAAGALSFDAQSDKHDFGVGIFKKPLLREALWRCGFIPGVQSI
jgi:hypothetical protein